MNFNPKDFSLFREFEITVSSEEIAAFTTHLQKVVQKLILIRTVSLVMLSLGLVCFILYGYILPYYNILILHGWTDLIVTIILIAMMAVPVLFAFVFNNLFKRVKYFHLMVKEMYNILTAESYYILFNPWGQIAKKLKYHQGGYAVAQVKSHWITGEITYKMTQKTYYDLNAKRNRSSSRDYSYVGYSLTKIPNTDKHLIELEKQPEKIVEKSIAGTSEEIQNTYAHLPKKERKAKIKSVLSSSLHSIIEKT